MPALDGLRGVALLMVFAFHACDVEGLSHRWRLIPSMGWSGVDLFFVLSGFLITGILLDNRTVPTYYKHFYVRRAQRILPVYYLALVLILLVQPIAYHLHHQTSGVALAPWRHQVWLWLNMSNISTAFYPATADTFTLIFWSLAVEEQFYALWPVIVRRLRDRQVAAAAAAGVLLSVVLRCLPWVQECNRIYPQLIYRLTPFRLDGLCMGALLAVFLRTSPSLRNMKLAVYGLLMGGVLVLAVGHAVAAPPTEFEYLGIALVFTSLVALCARTTGPLAGLLSTKLLQRVGRYSYFMYCFHPLILHYVGAAVETRMRGVPAVYATAAISLFICFGVAALSWKVFERPILEGRPTAALTDGLKQLTHGFASGATRNARAQRE